MRPFEEVYAEAVDAEGVSPEIPRHLRGIYDWRRVGGGAGGREAPAARPAAVPGLAEGRIDANCRAVDYFFCIGEWDWESMPHSYQNLFAEMGGGLHEAVAAPEIAEALDKGRGRW